MLTTKNERQREKQAGIISCARFLVLFALAAALAGCSPAGTHAFLKGKKLLDQGDYTDAADEFKSATEDMTTNAEAWNYLGVADQHAGQFEAAASAYQRALDLDRDLTEAHYNLGCLWLEQNKPDEAVSEFTAYTLRRANEPEGWVKLGLAQLRAHDVSSSEKSFSTAHYLNASNPEALNGLGMARMQRNRPEDAAKFFQAAVQAHPEYAPAVLNWATVEHEYLHNDRLALDEYHAYLALNPRPADWDDVNALATSISQPAIAQPAPPPSQNPARENTAYNEQRENHAPETRPEPPRQPSGRTAETAPPRQTYNPPREQTETVQVQPETQIVATPSTPSTLQPVKEPDEFAAVQPIPPENKPAEHDFNPLHWFRSTPTQQQEVKVTPLPQGNSINNPPRPVHIVQPAPPAYPHYLYLSPRKPAAGDRRAASAIFSHARQFEMQNRYTDALDSYRRAARLDPGWFEAQYNCGVMAYRLRDYQFSLASYEMALAIEPDSASARYNFALALQSAGYVPDAVAQLKKIVSSSPGDVRSHLEMGNIYAQQLYDVPHARQEYLKVLQLDPGNPQAPNIQFWLSANPE